MKEFISSYIEDEKLTNFSLYSESFFRKIGEMIQSLHEKTFALVVTDNFKEVKNVIEEIYTLIQEYNKNKYHELALNKKYQYECCIILNDEYYSRYKKYNSLFLYPEYLKNLLNSENKKVNNDLKNVDLYNKEFYESLLLSINNNTYNQDKRIIFRNIKRI